VNSDYIMDALKLKIEGKSQVFLIDGFPRSFHNLDVWYKKMLNICIHTNY